MKKYIPLVCLLAIPFVFDNCAKNPVTGKRQVVLMSEAQEIQMGQEADPQIVAQFGLYENPELQSFINEKGQQMASISHRPNIKYTFRIVDSEVINAFAVPGGYVYFTRGIMGYFNNEAEFAGVLGHEIGHITARHTVEQQRNAILGQVGLIAGIIIAPDLAQFAEAASQGLGLLLMKFGRDAERESDRLGVEYSSKIGYDAHQMANFFRTLERQGEARGAQELPNFLSTHPNPGDRFNTVHKLAEEWQKKNNLLQPQVNRNSYLRRIEGLIYGEDPKGGYRENNVFYHPVLRFQFSTPQGWNYQNTPQQVQLAAPDGKAVLFLRLAQGNSLTDAANNFLQQNKLVTVESRETTVNGLRALAVVADLQQQQGAIRTLQYYIQYGDNIYMLLGASALANFNAYVNTFNATMQSFRELNDAARINIKPERIRLKTVNSDVTLEQALRGFGVPQNRLQEISLLNSMLLTDRVASGTLIKVVERY